MTDSITIADTALDIWPQGQPVETGCHDTIRITRFADTAMYHPGLTCGVLAQASDPERSIDLEKGLCGRKVYDVGDWPFPEAQLIDARARAMFRHVLGCTDACVDLSWASVYQRGDYCMPHSHVRTRASIVYFLDPGEPPGESRLDGRFCIVDPRINYCCEAEPGRMTRPYVPSAEAGTMIMFPSQTVHCVNPYAGDRPRITLSWDIDMEPLPGPALPVERPGGAVPATG